MNDEKQQPRDFTVDEHGYFNFDKRRKGSELDTTALLSKLRELPIMWKEGAMVAKSFGDMEEYHALTECINDIEIIFKGDFSCLDKL